MAPVTLLVVRLGLSTAAYFLGRRKAFALDGRARGAVKMHSRPTYHGALMALWCAIPALIVFGSWLAFENQIITRLVVQELPESIRSLPECRGALFWMYDDCWGEVGWTIIDYYLARKPSYYAVKRAFAPNRLILRRRGDEVSVFGINDGLRAASLEVEYGYRSFAGHYATGGVERDDQHRVGQAVVAAGRGIEVQLMMNWGIWNPERISQGYPSAASQQRRPEPGSKPRRRPGAAAPRRQIAAQS